MKPDDSNTLSLESVWIIVEKEKRFLFSVFKLHTDSVHFLKCTHSYFIIDFFLRGGKISLLPEENDNFSLKIILALKLKVLVPLLRVKSDCREEKPYSMPLLPHPHFQQSLMISDKNIETTVLVKIVKRFNIFAPRLTRGPELFFYR